MSRIGKKIVEIPNGVTVSLEGVHITVKGPKGQLEKDLPPIVEVNIDGNTVSTKPRVETRQATMSWGTTSSHIANMVKGVVEGYSKTLLISGVGYKFEVKGKTLVVTAGFSHPVESEIPEGIEIKEEKGSITISGIDKEHVGQFAAEVRDIKRTEPYKGHGIRYSDEYVIRKQGKKAKA